MAADRSGEPLLTVGMPLYNNARTIRRALDSLLAQTFRRFQIVISDDRSTDNTADICRRYATSDSRVTLIQQTQNLNYGNFRALLDLADTPFFMFAAGDDYWHPNYAERMMGVLNSNPAAVCAVSRVAFMKDDTFITEAAGTRPLVADRVTNILRFLAAGDDNSRMYGVFRTPVAQRAFPRADFFAFDWAFSIGTLCEGTHVQVPEVLMWRDYTDPVRYIEYVQRDSIRSMDRVFPMLPLTRDIVRRLHVPITKRMIGALLRLNTNFHLTYLRRYHPTASLYVGGAVAGLGRIADRLNALRSQP